jgi:hypothetical protein
MFYLLVEKGLKDILLPIPQSVLDANLDKVFPQNPGD